MTSPHLSPQFVRFVAVGIVNTLVDFVVFFVLVSLLDMYFVWATVLSTTAALITSYTLNSRYTFDRVVGVRGVVVFMAITLAGIWVLQPSVIFVSEHVLNVALNGVAYEYILFASKVAASAASFAWNYVLYKKLVFRA